MLQLRPTFSESWYRVVSLKPRLRGTAQISRQHYRGERWYVVRDPAGNQYHRLSDAAYRFIGLLDGKRTVGEAWDLVGGQLADDAPTQPEVIQILSQLYAANLVETDVPPDAGVLLRRHKMQLKRQWQSRAMNILFPRIPIWDPDRFLKIWMPLAKIAFSRIGALIWIIVVGAALVMSFPHWNRLYHDFSQSLAIAKTPENIFWLFLSFWVLKFFHELGHAFGTRRFGGECHEMGIMFLVFVPTPYVDASAAWGFPSKWQKMFVGAGGMIVELFLAALAVFVWIQVKDNGGNFPLFLVDVIFWASFTTVLFNANPLLRYDGYYMLSDYLELPNLQQRSREYSLGLIKRHIFKIKPNQPLPTPSARFWLFTYNIFSSIYRVIVGLTIILYVTFQIPILGVLMGISGVVTWLAMPIGKLFKYLVLDPELHRKRSWPIIFSSVVAACLIVLVGLVPFPVRVRGEGVLEPRDKRVLYAGTSGFIKEIVAQNGQRLHKGDPILICISRELETEIYKTQADIQKTRAQLVAAGVEDMSQAEAAQQYLSTQMKYLKQLTDRREKLTLRAPIDGELVAPDLENAVGKFLPEGQQVAVVQDALELKVKGTFTQDDVQLVKQVEHDPNALPEVRLVGDITWQQNGREPIVATSMRVDNGATANLPHPMLGVSGGGEAATDPRDQQGMRSAEGHYEFRVFIANSAAKYVPGQRAYIRMKIMNRPLIWQGARALWQMIQKRTGESQWL